uniref:hephaestin-like protein isoform X2 n=1 Tax=Styela clava TaxID=7725 RepID=UPI00193ADB86|nr:hephaestin-like protein isoform X2 [Styela clava]
MSNIHLLFICLVLTTQHFVFGKERVYYIAIKEEIWDYAPTGLNLVNGENLTESEDAAVFIAGGPNRIGSKYWKAIYRQYTDDTYTNEIPKDQTLGFLGPTIIGEVGDQITIYAKNYASRNYSMHPHGVQYTKPNEGAVYKDNGDPKDQYITPGSSKKISWEMKLSYGPREHDPGCVTWIYHSHVDSVRDSYSGLVGGLLVCRPGTLDGNGKRTDVDRDYVLSFFVIDENTSWYIEKNVQEFCTDPSSVDVEDSDFQESNTMHGINGLMYGNLVGLTACKGENVAWNIFGLGNEVDIHSVHFEKQTVILEGHRQDTVSLFAAIFASVQMKPGNPGSSLIACRVNDHYLAGMLTTFFVNDTCAVDDVTPSTTVTKRFYIGIHEREWNYGPSGMNLLTGESLTLAGSDSNTFFEQNADRIGGTYKKALFSDYDDVTFTNEKTKVSTFGILGPLIAVEIGDVIEVVLKNFATNMTYNIEPHGLYYTDSSGVGPGQTHTYTWTAPDSVSPTDLDPDCVTYLYTSSFDPVKDSNSGLVGPLLVCKKGTLANALKRPAYYVLLTVMDENLSHYLQENIATYTTTPNLDVENDDFKESNLMHGINGLMYGNLQNISLCKYEPTDFHVIGLGTEVDLHSLFVSGVNINIRKENTAVSNVFPHVTSSMTVTPLYAGTGEIKCFVLDHLVGGMITSYKVKACGFTSPATPKPGRTLTYYIGAVEENWNYAYWNTDHVGVPLSDPNSVGYTFTHQQDNVTIGSIYKKAMYFEYTDGTFSTRKEKTEDMGLLGPVISAEEGDIINIVFKNMATRSYSIAPWGAKDIADAFNAKTTQVAPGDTHTYKWSVPSSAVPEATQPGCSSWFYMSNVDDVKDVYSGLIGPLLLCRRGSLGIIGHTKGIDKDFFLLFSIFDENQSHYLDENIQTFMKTTPSAINKEDENFVESNLMHTINGRVYHLPGLQMNQNENILWHLMGYGNEVDIHTAHFHAHAFTHVNDITTNGDVFELFPGSIGTVQMHTTEPGNWLLHCHVDDHINAGMITTYDVIAPSSTLEGWEIALICVVSVVFVVLLSVGLWFLCCRKSGTLA